MNDLPASELARIDAVCLEYEASLRRGESPSIQSLVEAHGGASADLLAKELHSIHEELDSARTQSQASTVGYFDPLQLPTSGTLIGPYVIGETIGRGGMGVVFKALDKRLNRPVAMKMLAIEVAKQRDLTERFERESRAVAAISHPNIIELFDVGQFDGMPYAVMEFLDGELLDARLKRGAMTAEGVRRIGAQIADALSTAHAAGVVHRDLKPSNVMLVGRHGGDRKPMDPVDSTSSIAKLFDFGLSRAPQGIQQMEETVEGVIMGTPGYMAPEQTLGESITPAADIFSLGCVLFEAFYGKLAFGGPTKARRLAATLKDEPKSDPLRRREDVALADLIQHCLQKDASDRPASAAVVANRLRSPQLEPVDSVVDRIESGYLAGQTTRRRVLELVGGGILGGAIGAFYLSGDASEIASVKSIAVLSFNVADSLAVASTAEQTSKIRPPDPVGTAELDRGERLAGLLVHELTRMSGVSVPRFRPLVAETPNQFREIGELLEVDALVTGDIRVIARGTTEFLEIDVQILSARTGLQLWGKTIQTESADNLLEQSRIATEIAAVIGQRLTSTGEGDAPPSVKSFNCLVDGKVRSDPDSLQGLEMALMCFQKARDADKGSAEPLAGIALTSITLAAQSEPEKAVQLIRQARENSKAALEFDPSSIDARLAEAMLDWQTVGRYQQAERAFKELLMVDANDWQVRHQYGLLQIVMGRGTQAMKSLREATQLNPMSVVAKVDRARAQWFSGNRERASQDAKLIRDRYKNDVMARGLLVDIYEQQTQFVEAAAEHDSFEFAAGDTAEQYFRQRREKLQELPYGPFGVALNEAILQSRSQAGLTPTDFAILIEPTHPPMLPLVLSAHPSMNAVRSYPRAIELLEDANSVI
ncbi:MAG: protein kinase [Rubripirellula sp.]